jgi:hypothetical protein
MRCGRRLPRAAPLSSSACAVEAARRPCRLCPRCDPSAAVSAIAAPRSAGPPCPPGPPHRHRERRPSQRHERL